MSILTVEQLREHVTTELGNDAVQRLLDAAEEAIVKRAGAAGAVTERLGGGYRFLSLRTPAASISSVVETVGDTDTTLAVDDFRLYPAGMVLERLDDGTNQRSTWGSQVVVAYTPVDQDSTRQLVQIELVKMALNYAPGTTEERIGEWVQRFSFDSAWTPAMEREEILSQLDVSFGMVVL